MAKVRPAEEFCGPCSILYLDTTKFRHYFVSKHMKLVAFWLKREKRAKIFIDKYFEALNTISF